ncbi:MAG: oligopeptide/dipeptide ABC transporter ATP-binding protein, partial [Geminicoccaceae bacterium]
PEHPYTKGLIACVPHLEPDPPTERAELLEIPGVVPALTDLGKGCAFAPRCNEALGKCTGEKPKLLSTVGAHLTACWVAQQEAAR